MSKHAYFPGFLQALFAVEQHPNQLTLVTPKAIEVPNKPCNTVFVVITHKSLLPGQGVQRMADAPCRPSER